MTAPHAVEKTTKTKKGNLITHVVPIIWGTFTPFSNADTAAQAAQAEKAKKLPAHAARAKDFAFELQITEPLAHELLHARILMEKDPSFTGPHTALGQGYLDIIVASQSPAVKTERQALRMQLGVLAGLNGGKGQQITAAVDQYDEFLVHEKFDSQKVFGLMGRSGATNQKIAEVYSKVVERGLAQFGGVSVSDEMERQQVLKLQQVAVSYFDAIDKALAAPSGKPTPPIAQPAPANKTL